MEEGVACRGTDCAQAEAPPPPSTSVVTVSFTDVLIILFFFLILFFCLNWERERKLESAAAAAAPPSGRGRRRRSGGPGCLGCLEISQLMICTHYVYVYINIFVCLYSIYWPGCASAPRWKHTSVSCGFAVHWRKNKRCTIHFSLT